MADARVLSVVTRMNVGGPAQILAGLLRDGGSGRFVHELVTGRLDDGEQDWLKLRAPDLQDDPRIHVVGDLVRPVSPRADLIAYLHVRALIREWRPDIVHTHTAKAGIVGRLAALHEGVPAIAHTFHGHVLHGYFGTPMTAAVRRVERHLARRTDRLFAVGGRVRDELCAAGIGTPEQYVVLPPGVVAPPSADRVAARRTFDIDGDRPVIAFVGRLAGVKRPDRFVAMAESVAERHPETVYLVAGGAAPGEEAALRARVRRADVRFLGWLGDVGRVYAAADLVALTSDNEGMPVTLIEAAMAGCPAVATDVGSVGEVVLDGHTGWIVRPDVEALTDAVSAAIEDPVDRRRRGIAARHRATDAFSLERGVERLEHEYGLLLA